MFSFSIEKQKRLSKVYSLLILAATIAAIVWMVVNQRSDKLAEHTPESRAAAMEQLRGMGQSAGF